MNDRNIEIISLVSLIHCGDLILKKTHTIHQIMITLYSNQGIVLLRNGHAIKWHAENRNRKSIYVCRYFAQLQNK